MKLQQLNTDYSRTVGMFEISGCPEYIADRLSDIEYIDNVEYDVYEQLATFTYSKDHCDFSYVRNQYKQIKKP